MSVIPTRNLRVKNKRSDAAQEHQKFSLTGIAGRHADLFLVKIDNTNVRGSGRHHETELARKYDLRVKRDEEHQRLGNGEGWREFREEQWVRTWEMADL
jgi:hypothetical protein